MCYCRNILSVHYFGYCVIVNNCKVQCFVWPRCNESHRCQLHVCGEKISTSTFELYLNIVSLNWKSGQATINHEIIITYCKPNGNRCELPQTQSVLHNTTAREHPHHKSNAMRSGAIRLPLTGISIKKSLFILNICHGTVNLFKCQGDKTHLVKLKVQTPYSDWSCGSDFCRSEI